MKNIQDISELLINKIKMENYCFLMEITKNSHTSSLYKIENNESKYAENIVKLDMSVTKELNLRGITIIKVSDKNNIEIKNIKKYNKELHTHEIYDLMLFQEYGIMPEHEQHKKELENSIKAEKIKNSLVYACYENDRDKILECLKKTSKAALNKEMKYTGTPLGMCIENNNLEMFKELVKAGASLDRKSLGSTPLEMAYDYSSEIVRYIYEEHNEQFKKEVLKNGFSIGAKCHNKKLLEILLEYDISINGGDNFPNVHICVDMDNPEALEFLIENGADINKKNMYKQTVRERAIKGNHKRVIKYLDRVLDLNK